MPRPTISIDAPSLKMRNLSPILTRLLLAVLALAAPVQAQDGVATDKAALEALYNATNGGSWTDDTNWASGEPLASWHGVTTNSDGRVTRLELDDNGLRGRLPSELGDLSELERLNLEDNALRGTLPSALANLTNLTSLRLTRSRALTGPLPDGLRELTDLSTVQIRDTELCAPDNDTFQAWWETISKTGLICPPTAQSVIEVAVFYTPAARSQAGGTAQMKARIDHMVAATNTAYRDGGVNQRIEAVAVEEVAYTEGTSETDLDRLHDPGDGYMDEVHAVRDRLGADIVLLIRRANAGTVSRAYLMTTASLGHASFAFGVVANIGGARHFAHELGHIMGLNHDRFVSCESGSCEPAAFPYAYGYVNQPGLRPGAPSSKPWLTIMAYTNQCTGYSVACQQLMRFSNPDQTREGDPLGIAGLAPSNSRTDGPSDAVRALNRTRGYVANFRQPPPDITVSFGAEAYEATEDGTGANVRLELNAPPTRPIDIPLTLTATGATAYDYTGVPAAVHFDADDTARTFTVRARDDAADDDGESVTLTLGAPLPAKVTAVSPSQTTVTLTDNDPDPGEPGILSVELTSDPGGDPYTIGDEIEVSVRFNKTVTVTGKPQLTLTMGTKTQDATYRDSAGEVVRFVYTVAEGDSAADGVSIAADSLSDGGTIRDSDDRDAVRTHDEGAADTNHRVDGTRPGLQSAEVNFTELTLIYDEALDATSVPAASAFWVRVGGARFNVTSVAVRGKKVTLTLSRSVPHNEKGTLISYTAGSGLRDPLGNPAASLSDHSVENVASSYDSDEDGDGLLEITNLAQLDAMRYDLDGDGTPSASGATAYNDAFPDFDSPLRCPSSGCSGYELSTDLDFDTNRNGMADADDAYWNNGAGWNPIGHSSADGFAATFKGNGHTIANLYINRTSVTNNALFARTKSSSTIRNVGLVNVDVTVTASGTGTAYSAGALVGTNRGTIRACYATGRVEGLTAGGLVANNQGTIRASYAAVRVRSGNYGAGGLTTSNSSGTIRDSYATGTVVSDGSSSSGLAIVNTDKIRDSYATGLVWGGDDPLPPSGGLVGANYSSGTITTSYWDTDTSGQTTSAGGATGQTTTALQTPTSATGIYSTWDTDLWHFGTTSQYPVLKADFDGDGTATWQEFGHQLRAGPALTVTTAAGQVGLEWTPVDADHWDPAPAVTYTVYRNDGTTIETVAEELNELFYHDLGVPVGAYTYQVAAVVNGGEATRSGLVAVTVSAVPEAPGNGNITVSAIGEGKLSVSWEAPESDGGASIDLYTVQWKSGSQAYDISRWAEVTDLTDLSYMIDGLIHGVAYTVQVRAFNTNGAGAAAEETATAENVAAVSFAQENYAVPEGGTTTVGVRLNKDPQRTVMIPLTTTPQDGATTADYTLPSSVTFSAGETRKEIAVTARDDDIDDDGESVQLGFGSRLPDGVEEGSPDTVTIDILDNDDPQVRVSFAPTHYTATEGGPPVTVSVTLDKNPERTVTIPLTATNHGAATADDYTGVPPSVTVTSDTPAQTFTVTATDDAIDDDGESVRLKFNTSSSFWPSGVTAGNAATVTLDDNDERGVAVSPTVLNVPEGGSKTYTVKLTSQPTGEVTVEVEVPEGKGVSVNKTSLGFTASTWNQPQTVTVDAADDPDAVADAPVTLQHRVSGGDYDDTVSVADVKVTIIENDTPTLTLEDAQAAESAGEMVFAVELSVESSEAVTVDYATVDGTARAGPDYEAQSDTLTFPANSTTPLRITVPLIDDPTDDAVEEKTFTVRLRNAEHATLAGGGTTLDATGTITDDDDPTVEVSFDRARYTVNEGKAVEVTLRLSADPERRVEIPLLPKPGDTVEESDYAGVPDTVVFESGDRDRTFSFIALADQVTEADETVTLVLDLGEPPPARVEVGTPATTVVTIVAPPPPRPRPPGGPLVVPPVAAAHQGAAVAILPVQRTGTATALRRPLTWRYLR